MVLTTFNKELYEQGLKEDATKEANEKIATLRRQLLERDEKLQEKDKYIAELEAKIAKANL